MLPTVSFVSAPHPPIHCTGTHTSRLTPSKAPGIQLGQKQARDPGGKHLVEATLAKPVSIAHPPDFAAKALLALMKSGLGTDNCETKSKLLKESKKGRRVSFLVPCAPSKGQVRQAICLFLMRCFIKG
jgi:hypothetical protein